VRIYEVLDCPSEETFPHLMDVAGHFGGGQYQSTPQDGTADTDG